MQESIEDYDVVVIGGGPGGSVVAGLLAQRGRRVLVLEREKFPRYHIGESLITGVFPALEELGVLDRLGRMGFTKKYGGTLVWGQGEVPTGWRALGPSADAAAAQTPGADTAGGEDAELSNRLWGFRFREASRYEHSYQVRRADFDAMLLGRARELGATVVEEASVRGPILDGERVIGVTYTTKGDDGLRAARARFVVDASGQQHLLARQFNLIEWHEDMRNIAVWAYFQNCGRLAGERAGDIITESRPDGWFWFIPLHDGTVSVGYVTPIGHYQTSGKSLEDLFAAEVDQTEVVGRQLSGAVRASAFRTIRDWSYTCQRFHGPGWVLVGDAAAFIDPLLSTGVTLAVRGAHSLAPAIDAILDEPEREDALLGRYESSYRAFLESLLAFVRYFYDRNRPRSDYRNQAQQTIDPDKTRPATVDFATMLSGLTGLTEIFSTEVVTATVTETETETETKADAGSGVFDAMTVDHVGFFVTEVEEKARWLIDRLGLTVYGQSPVGGPVHSIALGRDRVRFVLTEAAGADHPGAAYVERHGDGVGDIALRVSDVSAAFAEAIRRGARAVAGPARHGSVVTATIMGFGDVTHTFVERPDDDPGSLPGLEASADDVTLTVDATGPQLGEVDHFAICVEAGQLDETVAFYEQVMEFDLIFAERIVVGDQAMVTKVVQSRSGMVTLTLIEPDVTAAPGQVDEFLKVHGGSGVQHLALTSSAIVETVATLRERGVEFLRTPAAYYTLLADRVTLTRYSVEELAAAHILADEDHDGQLLQIFAQSTHARHTFFFEFIERLGARGFGSNNIKALYDAVRIQQEQEGRV